jgi:hemolysin activation/secretion protein
MRGAFCGLLLVACCGAYGMELPAEIRFTVKQFQIAGGNPLTADVTQEILQPYTGEHLGLEGLQTAADALEQALRDRGYSFHRVLLPPQTLQKGIVRLEIIEFKLGKVDIKNNRHFDNQNILRSLPDLKPGVAPNLGNLSRSLNLANTHPAKKLRLSFRESDKGSTIDADVNVQDSKLGSYFSVLQNTGTEESGDLRLSLGYQYNNLFNRDHGVSVIYTTAPDDTDAVSQYGFNYRLPMYGHGGTFSVLYSSSDVDSGVVEDFFEVSGSGTVLGLRYSYPFLGIGNYQHEVGIGYDDKLFENGLRYGGQLLGTDVRTNPLALWYGGRWLQTNSSVGFELTAVNNLASGSDSDDLAYNNVRTGAQSDWQAYRYSLDWSYRFTGSWSVQTKLKGQIAGEPLVPGEQFGLGGSQSIRGFEERSVLGDSGWQMAVELWAPPLTAYNIYTLLFYDFGSKELQDPDATSVALGLDKEDLASAGVGVRWDWRQRFSLRLDAGVVQEGGSEDESDSSRPADGDTTVHFGFFYRY